jgi:hypothetical protein
MRGSAYFIQWFRDQLAAFDPTGSKTFEECVSFVHSLQPVPEEPVYPDKAVIFRVDASDADGARYAVLIDVLDKKRQSANPNTPQSP